MADDPIIAEVRRNREALLAKYNYDIHAMLADMMRRQKRSGRKVVSVVPKKKQKLSV